MPKFNQFKMNADEFLLEAIKLGLNSGKPYSEDDRRQTQKEQLHQYQDDLLNVQARVHSVLDPYILTDLTNIVKTYISLVDHQSIVAIKCFSLINILNGGVIWNRLPKSSKPGFDEYTGFEPLPLDDDHENAQILMFHRVSPRFNWIQQTMRGVFLIQKTFRQFGRNRSGVAAPAGNAAGGFLGWMFLEREQHENDSHMYRLFVSQLINQSSLLEYDDQRFLTML